MKFNDEVYNQIKGTAMGTIFAPTYATLSMGILKSNFIVSAFFIMESFQLNISRKTKNRFLDAL